MTLSQFNYKTSIAVRAADLNRFGIVHFHIYLTYFEIAQISYWKNLTRWKSKTQGIVIEEAAVKYLKPLYSPDEIYAYVRTCKIGNCSFEVEYALSTVNPNHEGETVCATGKTRCVYFDFERNKPVKIPEPYREKMIAFEAL